MYQEKKDVGIDLFDIDDGRKEIFVYVNGSDRYPRVSCPSAVLKMDNPYKMILWFIKSGDVSSIYAMDIPKILNSTNEGCHDILFGENREKEDSGTI